ENAISEVYFTGYYRYYAQDFTQALKIFERMSELFPNNKHISEYWGALTAIQMDSEAKTGQPIPYIERWLATPFPEGKSATPEQFVQVYQYLTYYYYNQNDKANAVKYANLLLQNDADSKYAQDILNYFK